MRYFVGLTIGPIFDTILEASTPSALWFGSTLFSDITRRLCIKLTDVFSDKNISMYSPAFDDGDRECLRDGVGKYHDRIIFSVIEDDKKKISEVLDRVIDQVKEDTVNVFNLSDDSESDMFRNFLKDYLQINYCIIGEEQVSGDNCILKISPYLDALELMKTFPRTNIYNPISWVMTRPGKDQSASARIKETSLFVNAFKNNDQIKENNQFLKNNTNRDEIREIEDIALGIHSGEKKIEHKYQSYYAVVNADADGMGNFLNTISSDQVTGFSKQCLEYDKEASKMIGDYGGMTIYAGGDDLLFLAPVKKDGKTVFELCKEISEKFKEILEKDEEFKNKTIPTVSFGIAIHFKKYPLYEALNDARELLKSAKNCSGKNCMAINLEKHSGQSASLIVGNDDDSRGIFDDYMKLPENHLSNDRYLKNIGSKIELNYGLLKVIDDSLKKAKQNPEHIRTSWENLFDNEGQKGAAEYIAELNQTYYKSIEKGVRICTFDKFDKKHDDSFLNSLLSVLRISKFFMEEPGEEDNN